MKSNFDRTKKQQIKVLTDILKNNHGTQGLAAQLAQEAHAHASRFFEEEASVMRLDCEKGCSYCCHQPATVFAFEAIQIAKALKCTRTKDEVDLLIQKMRERVKDLDGDSLQKNINNKTACPLLSNGECSVYENRPLTCRLAHSFSVKKCKLSFEKDRKKVQIPASYEYLTGVSGIIEALYEELPKSSLDGKLYELCSAVLVALEDQNAADKWTCKDFTVFSSAVRDDT